MLFTFDEELPGKQHHERQSMRWEDHIKIGMTDTGCEAGV